jgi:phage terminase large subunit
VTTPVAVEVAKRGKRPTTVAGTFAAAFLAAACIAWPSPKYQAEPELFAREVVGVEPWSRQVEILEAIRDHKRVAVSSGHKIGKSNTGALAALWFFHSYEDARVVMTCVTARQVDEVLYREVRKLHSHAGLCVECWEENDRRVVAGEGALERPCDHSALPDGDPAIQARTGIHAFNDFREIVGFTAKEAEAVAGVSGKNLLYIIDEASGVPQEIFDAIEGNRAGGARVLLLSNPTQNEGEFYEAFESKSRFYKTFRVSSEESPNVVAGREVIPGLATSEWIEEKKLEWGEESALYKVRVKGQHVKHEAGKCVSLHLISMAEQAWAGASEVGTFQIGLDPAGEGENADETAWAVRRGLKQLALEAKSGMSEDEIVAKLLDLIATWAKPRERVIVTMDRTGELGDKVYKRLRSYLDDHKDAFVLVGVRSNLPAVRNPEIDLWVRDELLTNLAHWLRQGFGLLTDVKLAKDLHAPSWGPAATSGKNASKRTATPKKLLRVLLGRSPDRGDATALSVWEPTWIAQEDEDAAPAVQIAAAKPKEADPYEDTDDVSRALSPYGGAF